MQILPKKLLLLILMLLLLSMFLVVDLSSSFQFKVEFKHPIQTIGEWQCLRRRLSSRHSPLAFKPLDLCNSETKFTRKCVQYVDRKSGLVISTTASAILAQRGLALVNRSKTETKQKSEKKNDFLGVKNGLGCNLQPNCSSAFAILIAADLFSSEVSNFILVLL